MKITTAKKQVLQALDGRLMEVWTMGELLLGEPKGGRSTGYYSFIQIYWDFDFSPLII